MDLEIKSMIALQALQALQANFNQRYAAATIHQKIGNLKRL